MYKFVLRELGVRTFNSDSSVSDPHPWSICMWAESQRVVKNAKLEILQQAVLSVWTLILYVDFITVNNVIINICVCLYWPLILPTLHLHPHLHLHLWLHPHSQLGQSYIYTYITYIYTCVCLEPGIIWQKQRPEKQDILAPPKVCGLVCLVAGRL